MRDKKILIVLIIAVAVILIQKLDFDLVAKNELEQGQVEGVSEKLDNNLKIIVFDVGQGDSIFIETPNQKQILVDGGESQIILERLKEEMNFNDREIDIIVLTHPHADHVGGLVEVLKRYEVNEIWMTGVVHSSNVYLEFLNLIKEKNIPTKIIWACGKNELPARHDSPTRNSAERDSVAGGQGDAGGGIMNYELGSNNQNDVSCSDVIEIEPNVKFKILYPLENLFEKRIDNLNNSSIVIRLDYEDSSFLLAGDAEVPAEKKMLGYFNEEEFRADVLKVGHQGASDASSEKFLKAVRPEYAIISVGKDNMYGHPSLRVIRRMERMGIKIFRTDESGGIKFITDKNNFSLIE